jgi:CRISPR/Cas system CSM-associated protein Csm5 (group 7 of RAMP superfamily)
MKATVSPFVPGFSIKGVLRAARCTDDSGNLKILHIF